MAEETAREDISENQRKKCIHKLEILKIQEVDLMTTISALLKDIMDGKKYMKLYKQMKMYNDPSLNPVLYGGK